MTLATFGCRRHQASASWARLQPASAAIGPELLHAGQRVRIEEALHERPVLGIGGAGAGRTLRAGVLAGEHALGQRAPHDLPEAVALADGDHGALDAPVEDRILGLVRDRPVGAALVRDAAGALDLFRLPLGDAPVEELALADQVLVRLHGLVQRRIGVGAMALVQVQVVGAEPAQRALDALEEMLARQARDRSACPTSGRRPWWRSPAGGGGCLRAPGPAPSRQRRRRRHRRCRRG